MPKTKESIAIEHRVNAWIDGRERSGFFSADQQWQRVLREWRFAMQALQADGDAGQGIILAFVRLAWGHPTAYLYQPSDGGLPWGVRCAGYGGHFSRGQTKISALMIALESKP
jgi:hypothetical protein